MGNKVQQFLNDNFGEVRVFGQHEQIWFCANDCLKILEYAESGWSKKVSRLNSKGVTKCHTPTNGGIQELSYINEPNLYKLVFGSKMNKAEEFQDWICSEVIPTIRQTGGYVEDAREEEFVSKYFPSFSEEIKLAMVQDLLKTNKELKVKANKWDKFLDSNGLYSFTEVSKLISTMASEENSDINISVVKLTEFLRNEGVLSKTKTPDKENKKGSYKNLPNQDYQDYFNVVSVETKGNFNKTQTKVKSLGIEFIYDLVKEKYNKAI